MVKAKADKKDFPREGMDYKDRFRLTVGDFGRKILIELNRGTAEVSDDKKTVVITYEDSASRKALKTKKGKAPKSSAD
jgi:hypothetical protein